MGTLKDVASFICFNRNSLAEILPHRGPALRKIDGVFLNLGNPKAIIGIKQIQPDDPDIEGHFPGAPTYPGYAQDEFVCLVAAAFVSCSIDGLSTNPHVVQKIAKYKKSAAPGDTLTAEVKFLDRRGRFFLFSAEIRNQRNEIIADYEKIVGAV